MDKKIVSTFVATLVIAAMPGMVWAGDAGKNGGAGHESLRNRICPGSDTPGMSIEEMLDTERQRMAPAQVFDDLYMLGMKTVTAWALVTDEGIILFDAMLHYNVEETVVGSLKALNLDPADVEYVVISHAHNDHFGGASYVQDHYGARILLSKEDWAHMKTWPQLGSPAPLPHEDIVVSDGDTITLGDTTVEFVLTPGHTPGTLSPVFPVHDGDDIHYVGYWGGAAFSFLSPEDIAEYMRSAERFAAIDSRIDVPLSNHPYVDDSLHKLATLRARGPGDPHPFVEGNSGFRDWMAVIHDCAGEVRAQKLQESEED
jgi:metallo-beta-lactamase class B